MDTEDGAVPMCHTYPGQRSGLAKARMVVQFQCQPGTYCVFTTAGGLFGGAKLEGVMFPDDGRKERPVATGLVSR